MIVDEDTKTSTMKVEVSLYSMQIFAIVFGIIAIVLLTCCVIILCTCLFACIRSLLFRSVQVPMRYQARDRRRRLIEERKRKREHIVDTILKENACQTYSDATIKFEQNNCVICLEDFDKLDKVIVLPECFHVFHNSCVTEW